ncbi:hypothetical protein [Streptomyces nigrescens]|uniref:hypothetical protein n=1 Tax=Streptomyces nigrescens TaxID=1920 RepID=UPI00368591E9
MSCTHTRRPRTGTTVSAPPAFSRPSLAPLARAYRGYAWFLAHTTPAAPDDHTADHAPDGAARNR